MLCVEAAAKKSRTIAVRGERFRPRNPPFRLYEFVAQKVHFRCSAKRVLDAASRNFRRWRLQLPEPQCDEADNRDHQAFQAG